jgi:hypothetical protein
MYRRVGAGDTHRDCLFPSTNSTARILAWRHTASSASSYARQDAATAAQNAMAVVRGAKGFHAFTDPLWRGGAFLTSSSAQA